MSRATIIGPESESRVADGMLRELGEDLAHRPAQIDAHHVAAELVVRHVGQILRGVGLELLEEHAVARDLAQDWRSAEHDTPRPTGHDAPWRGSRITRTSCAKYLPPNCAPMPVSLQSLLHLLLERRVAERAAVLVAGRGQVVEVARGRELHGLERHLGGGAADHEREVVGRTGRRAERADLLGDELQ